MLRFFSNRWSLLFLAVLIAGVSGGAVALGEHATSERRQPVEVIDGRSVLQAPGLDGWNELQRSPKNNPGKAGRFGSAFHYDSFVYDKAASSPRVAGVVRRGSVVKVGDKVGGSGCNDGSWYKAAPFGYVCTSLGFHVSDTPSTNRYGVPPAKVSNHLPYQYSRVITKRAPRYYRIPTVQEEKQARRAMEKKGATPEAVSSLMEGDYFLALAEKETRKADGAVFYRTVRGRFVRESDVELRNPDVVRGEELGHDGWALPLAIVYGEDRELLNIEGSAPRVTGTAKKHARFVIKEELTKGNVAYVSGTPGAVRRDQVRVARRTKRPSDVPANGKWIHVDLSEQTLVAYEGDDPVYATLISSGKEGYEPPTGLFEVEQKYISTTMNATDPIDGFYEVEEVPWTLYYHGGYALHGAYWHTDFGKVRSHGCTNIAPVDARWLYYWSEPEVPTAWHAIRFQRETTWIHFTS
ncbi:MAG: L,D-transpeptidase [Deltaproteobacteria bacterium]|nr:L,D-transpeptidase [Deltaproteobacteria bacterium]MBW1874976.1 L,D-transpeptidase [Deltaproteobacteria bacterium]MBW2211175.1 L,D-transpeptidase [Deltaproteobacteria bacterium]MBW2214618.1 L,D-transpeptidase [Deltaproteobacteria bacterium]MBW2379679.1 L,D-transpeptidase [Deltaproteobacteria bacterium]